MYSKQSQYGNEAGRNFSNHGWREPRKPKGVFVQFSSTEDNIRKDLGLRYLSSSTPSPPQYSPPKLTVNGSINNNHYSQRPPDASNAKEYRDNLSPVGNQQYQDKSWTKTKNDQIRNLTQNPTRNYQQSSPKIYAHNLKLYKQNKLRMLKKLNQQEKELGLKDQRVARMIAEVARLERGIHVSTVGLRNAKIKIKNQSRYIRAIFEKGRMLNTKNLQMKDDISGLEALKRENQQQKEQIQVMAYNLKNWGELVLLLKKAETLNKALRRMVKTEAFSSPRYTDNFTGFLPLSPPTTSSLGSPYKHTKPLNPEASCFKSITHRNSPNIQLADDEKSIIKEKITNPNQARKIDTKNDDFFAAEMKRKFAEVCKEDNVVRRTFFVKVNLDVIKENDNSFAVKVALPVFMSNSSSSSHREPVNAKVMNFPGKDYRKYDLSSAKQSERDTEAENNQFEALSLQNYETISQTFGFEDLYSAVSPEK